MSTHSRRAPEVAGDPRGGKISGGGKVSETVVGRTDARAKTP